MNKITFGALAALALSTSAFAGQPMMDSKEYKDFKGAPEPCFSANEFSFDVFGAYTDGNGHDHAGPFQDHGWGGGLGVNYFLTNMIGFGVDASLQYGRENPQNGESDDLESAKHTGHYAFTGSVIFRFPIESLCMAPYVFAGGGFHTNGDEWASAHAGVGLEYRIIPGRLALFTDGRFTYFGTRYGHDDQNNYTGRAGVRLIF